MKNARVSVAPAVVLALIASGCGGGPDAPRPAAPPASTVAPATTAPPAASAEYGVAECDSYVKNYMACVDSKVPEAARASMRLTFMQSTAQWKKAAATPEGRTYLANACRQADVGTKQAMTAYGCTW